MARGGARSGAGRKAGTITTKTREIAEKALKEGKAPLDYMLDRMRDESIDSETRDKMAIAAAPYMHAKLAAVQHTGADGGPIQHAAVAKDASDDALAAIALGK